MPTSTHDTIATLLQSVIDETDDPDLHFKLRTALQLLVVLETNHADAVQTLQRADIDDELRNRLRTLGYL